MQGAGLSQPQHQQDEISPADLNQAGLPQTNARNLQLQDIIPGPPAPSDPVASNSTSQPTSKQGNYYSLASFMAGDRELAQFKRFGELNMHSLLMQQAELIDLESDLRAQGLSDSDQGLNHSKGVQAMLTSMRTGKGSAQWDLVLKIRKKLKAYNKALLIQAELWKIPTPRKYDARVLRYWLASPQDGNNFLGGTYEHLPYIENQSFDLVAIAERNCDSFTAWIAESFMPWAVRHRITRRGRKGESFSWPDSYLPRVARSVAIVASSLIPSLAILILYYTPNTVGRIFLAMGLSLLFSLALTLMTVARPAEVFAATAAFAAVQVVFIGSASIHSR